MRPCRPNTSRDGGSGSQTSSWSDHRRRKLGQHRHLDLVWEITDVMPEKEFIHAVCLAQSANLIRNLLARSLPHPADRDIVWRSVIGVVEQLQESLLDVCTFRAVSAKHEVAPDCDGILRADMPTNRRRGFQIVVDQDRREVLLFRRDKRYQLAALAPPEAHSLHAVAERCIHRRMWLLQRPGNNADLPQSVVLIHGMRGEVCGRC